MRFIPLYALLTFGLSLPALAERADRNKPVELEADRVTVDDKSQTQIFEGGVRLNQGTLQLRGERLEVLQDDAGFQRGTVLGNSNALAWFKQKREGREDFVEGQAERIIHDSKNEVTEFIGKAWVKNGADEVSGPYIRYDGKTQNYQVNNQGAGAKPVAGDSGGRVRAVIQPKNSSAAPAAGNPPTAAPAAPR